MNVPIPDVHIGFGLAAAALAVPLILRRVPMNHFYGIRVRKAYTSDSNWYAINAFGGWLFLCFGVFLVACGFLGRPFAPEPSSPWAPVYLFVPLLVLVPLMRHIRRYARQRPEA